MQVPWLARVEALDPPSGGLPEPAGRVARRGAGPAGRPPERVYCQVRTRDALAAYEGWKKWNRHYWRQDWKGFVEFFSAKCLSEPDSEDAIRYWVGMGLETSPDVIIAIADAPSLGRVEVPQESRSQPVRPASPGPGSNSPTMRLVRWC